MVAKKDGLRDYFKIDQIADVSTNYGEVIITKNEAELLAKTSSVTANKVISCPFVSIDKDRGECIIQIEKKFGLTIRETIFVQKGMNPESFMGYHTLLGELMNSGYSESEAMDIVWNSGRHSLLTIGQREVAVELLKQVRALENEDYKLMTAFINDRLISDWDLSDTLNLPKTLFNNIRFFIVNEDNGWVIEEKKGKINQPVKSISTVSTTTLDEQKNLSDK